MRKAFTVFFYLLPFAFALCGQFVVGRGNTTFVLELPVNFYGQDNLNIYNQVLNIVCALSVTATVVHVHSTASKRFRRHVHALIQTVKVVGSVCCRI